MRPGQCTLSSLGKCLCVPKTLSLLAPYGITYHRSEMIALMSFYLRLFTSPLKSKIRLEAENAILRHQLIVLERKIRGRVRLTNSDRLFFIWLYRWFPSILEALRIIRPETLVRWHRVGFRRYWHWKSRSTGGRPQINADLRALIRQMSVDNPLREPTKNENCKTCKPFRFVHPRKSTIVE